MAWLEGHIQVLSVRPFIREGKEHTALWRIMLDASTVRKFNLQFDRKLTLGEDTKFINTYLLHTESVGVLEKTLYYLTIREGSANVTSNGNPELMTQNKIKLICARKEIDEIAESKGYSTHEFWEGTMVLSAVQLAIRLSHNSRRTKRENRKIYLNYMNNLDVKQAICAYHPHITIIVRRPYRMKAVYRMLAEWYGEAYASWLTGIRDGRNAHRHRSQGE